MAIITVKALLDLVLFALFLLGVLVWHLWLWAAQ